MFNKFLMSQLWNKRSTKYKWFVLFLSSHSPSSATHPHTYPEICVHWQRDSHFRTPVFIHFYNLPRQSVFTGSASVNSGDIEPNFPSTCIHTQAHTHTHTYIINVYIEINSAHLCCMNTRSLSTFDYTTFYKTINYLQYFHFTLDYTQLRVYYMNIYVRAALAYTNDNSKRP